ncbi:MAG: zinc ribbon domain-containing protein [Conexivisphaerales archaeon]
MNQLESLKCSQCGAPLPPFQSEMVTCPYCGVTQQRIDAEKYVQQLTAEVYSWIKSMIPAGTQTITQADPIARSQIFESLVRPSLEQRSLIIDTQFTKVGANCLIVPPFVTTSPQIAEIARMNSKQYLEDASKYEGLSPLAQSTEQISLISLVASKCEAMGFLTNVASIHTNNQLRSYEQVSKNFDRVAEILSEHQSYAGVALRSKSLASMARAIMLLQKGQVNDAIDELNTARSYQNEAASALASSPSMLSWYAGLKSEMVMLDSLNSLAQGLSAAISFGLNYGEALGKLEIYTKTYQSVTLQVNQANNGLKPDTYQFVAHAFRDIYSAKAGLSSAPRILGNGPYWAYCWLVELNYTFETGMLFMKKGVPTTERFLLPAQFPLYYKQFQSSPHDFVLDIFSVKAPSKFWDRVSGKETALTTGLGYQYLSQLRTERVPPSAQIIPPYCTKVDADRAANYYLDSVRNMLRGKLKLSIPTISQPVLAGGSIVNGRLIIQGIPDYICPYIGDESAIKQISF